MLDAQRADNAYTEGVFVGYRYAGTFGKTPAYAFGFGLSYTSFRVHDLKVIGAPATASAAITVQAVVTNSGRVAGREVAQLYVSAPRGALDKPERELRAFAKTGVLAPGASQTMTFRLTVADIASYDPSASAWIADAGTYTARVSNASNADGVYKTFALPKRIVVEERQHRLVPTAPLTELKAPAR
jgi:beta-glucosidase